MTDFIIAAVLLIVVGLALGYIIKAKKSGVKCIGCPAACNCKSKGNETSCCGCQGDDASKELQ